jgi:hypothetical protein
VREAVWGELVSARADYVNMDHLEEIEVFLLKNDPRPTQPHVSWTGRACGRRTTVLPGALSKLLAYSLAPLPRWARVRIMGGVMGGMTEHRTAKEDPAPGGR